MLRTFTAGGVVVNEKLEIIIVSQGNTWSLPKGHIETNETALDTAKREVYEESGVTDLTYVGELGSYERYKIALDGVSEDRNDLKTITMFHFTTSKKKLQPVDPHNPEAKWVTVNEAIKMLSSKKDSDFLKIAASKIGLS